MAHTLYLGWVLLEIKFCDYCLKVTCDYCNIAILQLLIDTVYDSKNRLTFTLLILVLRAYGSRLSVIAFFNCIYYLIAVRQYFAIAIILAVQNHAIRLLQCNNIAIYWIFAQPYTVHNIMYNSGLGRITIVIVIYCN